MDGPTFSHLCEADQQALDSLIDNGFDAQRVPQSLRPRAERIMQVMSLLDRWPAPKPSDDLTDRTLAAIEQTKPLQLTESGRGGGFGLGWFSLRDLAAAAAILLVGVSMMWPILASARSTARQAACQASLATTAQGLFAYASDNRDAMPATRARLGDPWWRINTFVKDSDTKIEYAQSNSAHLFVAVRNQYVTLDQIRCPANPNAPRHVQIAELGQWRDWHNDEQASFSYQNQYALRKPKLAAGPMLAVLADKNPFFENESYRMELDHDTNAANHDGRGQNVLMSDGSAVWSTSPRLINGDNIYHTGDDGYDSYTGLEGPADESDSFLVP